MPTCNVPDALVPLLVPLDALRLDPRNARLHGDRNLAAIRRSYERFGQQKPIVVNAEHQVVAGNGQVAAARSLGWTHIAAIQTDLAGHEALAFALADNKTSELAEWDAETLATLIAELQEEDAALVEATGFDEADINALLAPPEAPPGINDIPAPPDAATTKPGDLWQLGEHRLLCGDAGQAADVDRLLDGAPVHLVNMDPPYNVKVEPRSSTAIAAGQSSYPDLAKKMHHQTFDVQRGAIDLTKAKKKMRARDRPIDGDFLKGPEFAALLQTWFGQVARVLAPGRSFYIWAGYHNLFNYPAALAAVPALYFSQTIIWVKGHPVLTRKDYMGNHEWCFYGWRTPGAHWFAPGIYNAPDVWEITPDGAQTSEALEEGLIVVDAAGREFFISPHVPAKAKRRLEVAAGQTARFHTGPTDVWRLKKISPQKMIHLTEKPVELALRAMHYSSRGGENVLDLFGGSGSTLMAAEVAGRKAYLMELDALYCDVIVQRFRDFTGKEATLA